MHFFSFSIFILLSSPYNKILSQILLTQQICRLVHSKMLIVSSFTQRHVVPNLCNFIFSLWSTEDILKNRFCPYNQSLWRPTISTFDPFDFNCVDQKKLSSKNILHNIVCVLQKINISYRFETTTGLVNDEGICILEELSL